MKLTERILKDPRVVAYNEAYMKHPFILGLEKGDLDREKFKRYLIQDSLYLKDYGKVYASIFLEMDRIEDLQFLHTCIGVVVADETNMHTQYLKDYGLDVYKVDDATVASENRAYLDFMLSYAKKRDARRAFVAAYPCTITYEYIGKTLKAKLGDAIEGNYFRPWIEAYASESFEDFSVRSCEIVDRLCENCTEAEVIELIDIYVEACRHELNFWDMSYGDDEEEK